MHSVDIQFKANQKPRTILGLSASLTIGFCYNCQSTLHIAMETNKGISLWVQEERNPRKKGFTAKFFPRCYEESVLFSVPFC